MNDERDHLAESFRTAAARPHRRISSRLVIATHNPGKLVEMRELLALYGVAAVSASERGLPEPDETGTTFAANARIKAEAAAHGVRPCRPSRTTSGLAVDALGGEPGIYSRRAGPGPSKDFSRRDGAHRRCCLAPSAAPRRRQQRKAHFVSALCVAWPDGHVEEFEAKVDGTLV